MTANLTLNRKALLSFFDVKSPESRGHVSAIVGVVGEDVGIALLRKCLVEQHGTTSRVITEGGVPKQPTNGTGKGPRLDRWLLADETRSSKRTLYQVEIKNWSATAIGGKELRLDAAPATLRAYKRLRWLQHWDSEKGSFRHDYVGKVLSEMSIPTRMDDDSGRLGPVLPAIQRHEVEPMLCFWWAVHPDGDDESLFPYPLPTGHVSGFSRLMVFSMSSYLRSLTEDEVVLEMPVASRRIEWLNRLFRRPPRAGVEDD